MLSDTLLFTGNANPALAREIAADLGLELGKAAVGHFSDGEVTVEIQQNVRARDVFIVQPTCAPTNEHLMELLLMVDALKRASARRITAVIPYYGYARQDRRPRSTRVPISAKVVANMLEAAGVNRVLALLPNAYMQGNTAGINMAGGKASFDRAIPMNAIGFMGLHIITAGTYDGETYVHRDGENYKILFYKEDVLKGYILIGDVARAGIYTALIRNRTPLSSIDFKLICEKPQLMAFTARTRRDLLSKQQ